MTPPQMKALVYTAPSQFSIWQEPVPLPAKGQILIKGASWTKPNIMLRNSDVPYLNQFLPKIIPGHEVTGTIESIGEGVDGYAVGDRCVVEPAVFCGHCFFSRRGNAVMCERMGGRGFTIHGGFTEYILTDATRVFKIKNLADEEAILIEPTSCAIYAMDRLQVKVGVEALVIGAGPSGLMLAQLLKINGASKVVIVAPAGSKMEVAKRIGAGDEYVELDRTDTQAGWQTLKKTHSRDFDVVVGSRHVFALPSVVKMAVKA
ncbi:GroES-like protein [Neolentinus lepideus HHB14362 ss-1]|uniref:GroES-like protein n=1 Tax=Neolentinus lepideus HHB14362 ss-1 TaxID=1314782 RepID=A0A165QBB5_9AGAM|nr:GroES-like protein [Neolentinus lepideus HHB14362 ss-1]